MTERTPEEQDQLLNAEADESPENLPPKAWVTLIMFAVFVVAFGTCASTYLFN